MVCGYRASNCVASDLYQSWMNSNSSRLACARVSKSPSMRSSSVIRWVTEYNSSMSARPWRARKRASSHHCVAGGVPPRTSHSDSPRWSHAPVARGDGTPTANACQLPTTRPPVALRGIMRDSSNRRRHCSLADTRTTRLQLGGRRIALSRPRDASGRS